MFVIINIKSLEFLIQTALKINKFWFTFQKFARKSAMKKLYIIILYQKLFIKLIISQDFFLIYKKCFIALIIVINYSIHLAFKKKTMLFL